MPLLLNITSPDKLFLVLLIKLRVDSAMNTYFAQRIKQFNVMIEDFMTL